MLPKSPYISAIFNTDFDIRNENQVASLPLGTLQRNLSRIFDRMGLHLPALERLVPQYLMPSYVAASLKETVARRMTGGLSWHFIAEAKEKIKERMARSRNAMFLLLMAETERLARESRMRDYALLEANDFRAVRMAASTNDAALFITMINLIREVGGDDKAVEAIRSNDDECLICAAENNHAEIIHAITDAFQDMDQGGILAEMLESRHARALHMAIDENSCEALDALERMAHASADEGVLGRMLSSRGGRVFAIANDNRRPIAPRLRRMLRENGLEHHCGDVPAHKPVPPVFARAGLTDERACFAFNDNNPGPSCTAFYKAPKDLKYEELNLC